MQGVEQYKANKASKLQSEFMAASTEEKRLNFAKENAKEGIAGTVFLELADKNNSLGNYTQALELYDKALFSLRGSVFGERILLSKALVSGVIGDKAKCKRELEELVKEKKLLATVKGEALYNLGILAMEEKNYSQSKAFFTEVTKLENVAFWSQKANSMLDTTPEFKN
jgi:hypothetical protein